MIFNELEVGDWFIAYDELLMKIGEIEGINIHNGNINPYTTDRVERVRQPRLLDGEIFAVKPINYTRAGEYFIHAGWIYIRAPLGAFVPPLPPHGAYCLQNGKRLLEQHHKVTVIKLDINIRS